MTATANSRYVASGKPVSILLLLHLLSVYPGEKPVRHTGCLIVREGALYVSSRHCYN